MIGTERPKHYPQVIAYLNPARTQNQFVKFSDSNRLHLCQRADLVPTHFSHDEAITKGKKSIFVITWSQFEDQCFLVRGDPAPDQDHQHCWQQQQVVELQAHPGQPPQRQGEPLQ